MLEEEAVETRMNSDECRPNRVSMPVLLAVGGLDPTGGAGVLVDAAASRAVGVHPAAVVAVSTVQGQERFNETRVENPKIAAKAISEVLSCLDVRAVKTGALGNAAIVDAIADLASDRSFPLLVIDPVILSSTGGALLDDGGVKALKSRLFKRAFLITPNLQEAAILTGEAANDVEGMRKAAKKLIDLGPEAVLVKGGHLAGDEISDLLVTREGVEHLFSSERLCKEEVRGTGCALASLTAAMLALGFDLVDAVRRARAIVADAIAGAVRAGAPPLMLRFGKEK